MKCHYEILEIPKEADDSVIKTAYRKLALKWHPDKNLEDTDVAKEQFQLVQQAYDILSDEQERAWYDAHRDQILRGANSEFQDTSLDVFQYFTTTCFKGYGDDENGFYTVYRKVFETLAKEDIEFMDNKEEFCEIPNFGQSYSNYEEVVKVFYDYWVNYTTKKSYSWLNPHDIREGRWNRKYLKEIEKENKESQKRARKERNEEVRSLVAFVRKRDKRVQTHLQEMKGKAAENKKRQELLTKQKRLERQQLYANEKQADWMSFENVKSELEMIEKHLAQEFGEELSDSENEAEDINNLYCIACNKVFKNPKAFENHEFSKRHRENVEKIKQIMSEEDIKANSCDCSESSGSVKDLNESTEENCSGEEHIIEENLMEVREQVDVEDKEFTETEAEEKTKIVTKKKKRAKNVLKVDDGNTEDIIFDIRNTSEDDFHSDKRQNKNSRRNSVTNNKDYENGKVSKNDDIVEFSQVPLKKVAKKDKKKNKKSTQDADVSEIDTNHCCVTCKENFPSKNKLFNHLKKTAHGVYITPKLKEVKDKKSHAKK